MLKIRKNPFNYFEDLDLLFDNLLIDSSNLLKSKNYHYTENEKEIIIEMAIPGVNKNDIKLVFSEGNRVIYINIPKKNKVINEKIIDIK